MINTKLESTDLRTFQLKILKTFFYRILLLLYERLIYLSSLDGKYFWTMFSVTAYHSCWLPRRILLFRISIENDQSSNTELKPNFSRKKGGAASLGRAQVRQLWFQWFNLRFYWFFKSNSACFCFNNALSPAFSLAVKYCQSTSSVLSLAYRIHSVCQIYIIFQLQKIQKNVKIFTPFWEKSINCKVRSFTALKRL